VGLVAAAVSLAVALGVGVRGVLSRRGPTTPQPVRKIKLKTAERPVRERVMNRVRAVRGVDSGGRKIARVGDGIKPNRRDYFGR
jgi:hypothetical protein